MANNQKMSAEDILTAAMDEMAQRGILDHDLVLWLLVALREMEAPYGTGNA